MDRAIADLDHRRAGLLRRRGELIQALRALRAPTVPAPWTRQIAPTGREGEPPPRTAGESARPAAAGTGGGVPGGAAQPARDASPPTVQNVLLALGGVLLTVAAVVFTVVSWGDMGIGGRAAVLLVLTAAALSVPAWLMRRRMPATAESVAGVGLALVLLDWYAARRTGLLGLDTADGLRYAAICLAVVSPAWALYGRRLRLRFTGHTALLLAQPSAVLLALSVTDSLSGLCTGLLVTAGVDAAVGLAPRLGSRGVRVIAAVTGAAAGTGSLGVALDLSLAARTPGPAARAGLLLAALAGLGITVAHRLAVRTSPAAAPVPVEAAQEGTPSGGKASSEAGAKAGVEDGSLPVGGAMEAAGAEGHPATSADGGAPDTDRHGGSRFAGVLAAVSAGAVIAGAEGLIRTVTPPGWQAVSYAVCALGVLGVSVLLLVRGPLPRPLPGGFAVAGAATQAVTVVWALPPLVTALLGPLGWAGSVWAGAPAGARSALAPGAPWGGSVAVPTVFALAAFSAGAAARWSARAGRGPAVTRYLGTASSGSLGLAVCAAATLPLALDLPYTIAVVELVAVVAVLLAASAALASVRAARTALASAVVLAVDAAFWSLAERPVTFLVLGLLVVLFTAMAAARAERLSRGVSVSGAVVAATGLVWSLSAASGLGVPEVALCVLAVRAGTLGLASWPRLRSTESGTVLDVAGTVATLVAITLALGHPEASLVTSLAGLLAGGAALRRSGGALRTAAVTEAGLLGALAPLLVAASFVSALLYPYVWLRDPWSGAAETARSAPERLAPLPVPGVLAATVLLAAAAVLLAAWVAGGRRWAARVGCGVGYVLTVVLPVALDLPYPLTLAIGVAGVAGLLAVAARTRSGTAQCAAGAGLVLALTVAAWSLADRASTVAVLAALTVLGAAGARYGLRPSARAGLASGSVVFAAAEAAAVPLAAGTGVAWAAFPVLAVAAACALLAARLREHPVGRSVELSGYAVAGVAVAMTLGDLALLALCLSLTGVLALGVSVRPDRRAAAYWGTALLVVAAWVRLADSAVHSPEAYTLPVSVPALVVGWLRRRKNAALPSWTAYGPGLSVTLLPSLVAAWGDPDWLRPLLLGVGALVVTLAGARYRLKAPLLLGGAVLALDALHELAPTVVEVAGRLPRWLPLALGGVLLIVVGATYERRLRDVRRLRESLARLG